MLLLIAVLLLGVAAYCLGMWLYLAYRSFRAQHAMRGHPMSPRLEKQLDDTERYTFHLGLCGTIALGFLGIMAAIGGM